MVSELLDGFTAALSAQNLLFALMGVLLGTLVGVLPGLGPSATIAMLLPLTYFAPADATLILLSGIYYGTMYGGSTTGILLNLPGEASSVITTIEGYQMAKQGRAGAALGIAAIGSYIAATLSIVGLTFATPLLARFALRFGPPEYTVLVALGLSLIVFLVSVNPLKGIIAALFGLLLATVGGDVITGTSRFTFGSIHLISGLPLATVAMGIFGLGEILYNIAHPRQTHLVATQVLGKNPWPRISDLIAARWAIARGSVVGFLVGLMPGAGATVATLFSYVVERRVARDPSRFTRGAIEGVAGPESANNAAAHAAFIPLLSLGIPGSPAAAILFGALLLHGIQPGPTLIAEHGTLFWTLVASMYIGNTILLALNLPLVGLFVQVLRVPFKALGPVALLIALVGAYSLTNDAFNVGLFVAMGIVGYLMRESGFPAGPFVLAFVLGPILEVSLRRSLLLSYGNLDIFVQRPISLALVLITLCACAIFLGNAARTVAKRRRSWQLTTASRR